jgi:hypothetical protein
VIKDRRKCFDSLIILVIWQLWLQRNASVSFWLPVRGCASTSYLVRVCCLGHAKIISESLIAGE